jgi:hypothetical protein
MRYIILIAPLLTGCAVPWLGLGNSNSVPVSTQASNDAACREQGYDYFYHGRCLVYDTFYYTDTYSVPGSLSSLW